MHIPNPALQDVTLDLSQLLEHPHQRMRRLREGKRMSLQDLADAVGMAKAHIWEYERSTARMERAKYINLCNIAAALGVSLSTLMQSR